jgi:hypothetical protein
MNEKKTATPKQKLQAFISYSHSDASYLDRLNLHLKPLERRYDFVIWSDQRLKAGDRWQSEIERNIDAAEVIVLLVSADFLASDFVMDNELPRLLRNAEDKGTKVFTIIVSPCLFEESELGVFQAVNDPNETLQHFDATPFRQEEIFVQCARAILSYLQEHERADSAK